MAAKRKKPRSVLRNLVIVLAVFVPLVVVVVMAKNRDRSVVLILPEEHATRQAQRTAPENGFPLLLEAAKLLPARPAPFDTGDADMGEGPWDEPGLQALHSPELHRLCLSSLPDNDPQFQKYVADSAPAAAKAHEALDKPFLLFPEARRFRDRVYSEEILGLTRAMIALGRVNFEKSPTADALTPLTDALRIMRALCKTENALTWAERIESDALQQIRILAAADPARVPVLKEILAALGPGYQPAHDLIRVFMLHMDDQLARQESAAELRGPQRLFRGAFVGEIQRVALILKEHEDEVLKLADEGPAALDPWLNKMVRPQRGPDDIGGILRRITLTLRRATQLASDFEATRIALALAAHKTETGAFPDTLDALAPKYLDTIPTDPTRNGPFGYKVTPEKGIVLYSVSWNFQDDNADARADRILLRLPEDLQPDTAKPGAP